MNVIYETVDILIRHEGYREHPYIDPIVKRDMQKKKMGWLVTFIERMLPKLKLTFGYGQRVIASPRLARAMLQLTVESTEIEVSRRAAVYRNATDKAKVVLLCMAYQMGVDGLLGFKDTFRLIADGDYAGASIEMLDSKWARDLHDFDLIDGVDGVDRAEELSALMANAGMA